MDKLGIFLSDGNWDGPVTMDSPSSMFKVIRVKKVDLNIYQADLGLPGVYFLLIGKDSVYVGQTSDSIYKRILSTHTGDIAKLWHTVVAFPFKHKNISNNVLLYIENAMCEFIHQNYPHCLTTTPAKSNCTLKYRNKNYSLNGNDILTCLQYIDDIKYYISFFKNESLFSGTAIVTPTPNTTQLPEAFTESEDQSTVDTPPTDDQKDTSSAKGLQLFIISKKKEIHAEGILLDGNRILVKAGSTIAKESHLSNQQNQAGYEAHRRKLIHDKIINDSVFMQDYVFASPSCAAAVIRGTASSGNFIWKTADGKRLGEVYPKKESD